MAILDFTIKDMDCAEEATQLTRTLLPLVGQESRLRYDLLHRKLRVDLADLSVTPEQIVQAIRDTGLHAQPTASPVPACSCCGGACATSGSFWSRKQRELLCLCSGVLWVAGMALLGAHSASWQAIFADNANIPVPIRALWILSACCGAWPVLPRAWASLRAMRPDMNLLMILAMGGAILLGEYSEGASVAFLFALANLLEAWSVGRARAAIAALMTLAPDKALVISPQALEPVVTPAAAVSVGARILIRPGTRIPLDGMVRAGSSTVDQSPITGESLPVFKTTGDQVFAGTMNADGALEVETTKLAADSTLARIMRLVEDAQSRRAQTVQWVDKFAAVYTPVMIGISILFAVIPPLVSGDGWSRWLYEALVILVISCPCALVIATPVSIVAGMASAARNGVLIKGGAFLEIPATLDTVAFDKTGTLTLGRPEVVTVVAHGNVSDHELLHVAATLESRSSHPLARAILEHAAVRGIFPGPVEDARTTPGLGASGRINGVIHYVGNPRYLASTGGPTLPATVLSDEERIAGTVIAVWTSDALLGVVTVADIVRPQALSTLQALKAAGVRDILMLTGDTQHSAERIAQAAGVTAVRAELMPEDKTRIIADLAATGRRVAMIGDGINDAPAMAAAHLSVAMGAIGTDVAIETADIALMTDDLNKLPWLIRHSRRTIGIIKANIMFALGIKAAFLILAAFQLATLWTAVLADLGTSLVVIFNALRLLRIRA